MKKILITVLFSILFITGCSVFVVSDSSINDIFDTVLYVDNRLSNTYMNGYKFYLPQGVKIVDKNDYNIKIKDDRNYYYLYVDTIAYYYKTSNTYTVNSGRFYSSPISHNDISGYVDIEEVNDKYFVVLMYNYVKIEAYIDKDDLTSAFTNMCYILSTFKFNDKVISGYIDDKGTILQEEEFNIFSSKKEQDNFLLYEKEYGTYKDNSNKGQDNEILDDIETIE